MSRANTGLCRDEHCNRLELHAAHEVVERKFRRRFVSKSSTNPWMRPAPKALDHSIAKAVSQTYPRAAETIFREVEHDYGSCCTRTILRRLKILVARGHILKIDLGERLYAYVRPGSSLVNDLDLMREQIRMMKTEQARSTAAAI